jgi:hypothetical protein
MGRALALGLLLVSACAGAESNEAAAQAVGARFDGSASADDLAADLRDAVSAVSAPTAPPSRPLPKDEAALLDDLSRREFRFFWEQADPKTGLVPDRAGADGSVRPGPQGAPVASVAGTGFGLAALCVGAERGWITRAQAVERARRTLRFLLDSAPQERGFFYHFMDAKTGARAWQCEVSSIDTTWLLAGALTARQCFGDAEVSSLATSLYGRVDFPWMLQGKPPLFSMGWTPESGFLPLRWDLYSEHMMLDLLAVGSPTHPVSPDVWNNWRRDVMHYSTYSYVEDMNPGDDKALFMHQYSQAFADFRGLSDGHGIDYFRNSTTATLAQRQFFADLSKDVPVYSANVWGGTASDTENGYKAWGGPPRTADDDGTVAPCAPGGSLMFTPEESLAALGEMKKRWGGKVYGRYGFVDAFNPADGWADKDVLGIDQGIMLLSGENARNGAVWSWFMKNPEIGRAMTAVGFKKETP